MKCAHTMRRRSLTMLDTIQTRASHQVRRSSMLMKTSLGNKATTTLTRRASMINNPAMNSFRGATTSAALIAPRATRTTGQTSLFRTLANRIYNVAKLSRYAMLYQLQMVNAAFKKHPLLLGSLFAGFKGLLADLFAQMVLENKKFDDVNWHRNKLFGFVGVLYTGFVVYAIYVKIYPKLFRRIEQWPKFRKAAFMSFVDQFIHNMVIYFPFFYAFKAGVYQGFSKETCTNAVHTYLYENMYDDMISSLSVWGPANIITFAMIPPHLKTPWLSVVSFVWIVVLSTIRGEQDKHEIDINCENIDIDPIAPENPVSHEHCHDHSHDMHSDDSRLSVH
jgi:hypothetical protein